MQDILAQLESIRDELVAASRQGLQRYLSANEAARYLGVSRSTFLKIRAIHNIPAVRIWNNQLRYDTKDLDRYAQSQKATR